MSIIVSNAARLRATAVAVGVAALLAGNPLVWASAPAGAAAATSDAGPATPSEAGASIDTGAPSVAEVTITGTHVVRDGFNSPTPVSVISAEEINATAPENIADFVNQLPAIRSNQTTADSAGSLSSGEAGISALSLRALGAKRTLVLFDGQRSVGSSTTGLVDINTFPQSLIERVDVVTGGASSAYGSDAVGGVVNFILNKKFTGLKAEADYGDRFQGGNGNSKFTLTGGAPFAGGAGHLLFSGELEHVNGLHSYSPDWNNNGHFAMQNPDTSPGQPYYLVANNVGIATYTPGGLVTSGSHAGTYFGVGGTLNQFALGPNSGQWQIGGDGKYATSAILGTDSLVPDQDRGSAFVRGDYDITPDITVFAQGSYARYKGLGYYIQPTDKGVVIQADNAYLPAGWQGESFTLGSNNADFPQAGSNNTRDTQRYVVGGNGSFSVLNKGFKWDAYYQKGITETDEKLIGVWNRNKLLLATDAVFNPSNPSQIVCRSTLTDPTNGCVPVDRFGIGVASQAALDYVLGNPERKQRLTQDVGGINLNTNDIQGWAGPISVAVGFEARKEQVTGEVNPIYSSGWKYGNYQVTQGSYNVKEGYVETVVPVITGVELNGAARFTDYSTSGSVTTWKAGITYAPIEDIKFRASRSNDIRAPDLDELFATGSARTNSGTLNGQNIQYVQALKGSTLLSPEQAHSWGAGFVFTPRFAPGFSLSVDYYDIVISKVIDSVSADQTLLFCSSGVQTYCNNIIGPVNNFYTVNLYYQNLDSLVSRGLDVEASYHALLGDIIPGAMGDLAVRLMATHYINNTTNNGSAAINLAGANDQYGTTPNWIYRLSAIYKLESWTADLTARGVSAGVVSHALTQCSTNCPAVTEDNYPYLTINDNHVAGAFYLDGSLTRSFAVGKSEGEVFLALTNILDKSPPLSVEPDYIGNEDTPGEPQTNRDFYDVLGRTWRVGVRFQL